jgi:hypothetical protein
MCGTDDVVTTRTLARRLDALLLHALAARAQPSGRRDSTRKLGERDHADVRGQGARARWMGAKVRSRGAVAISGTDGGVGRTLGPDESRGRCG